MTRSPAAPPEPAPPAHPRLCGVDRARWGNHVGSRVLALAAALALTRGWASLFFVLGSC